MFHVDRRADILEILPHEDNYLTLTPTLIRYTVAIAAPGYSRPTPPCMAPIIVLCVASRGNKTWRAAVGFWCRRTNPVDRPLCTSDYFAMALQNLHQNATVALPVLLPRDAT